MAARDIITKSSAKGKIFLPLAVSKLCFTSASKISETTDGKTFNKEHGTPVAEAGKRMSEMAGKYDKSTDGASDPAGIEEIRREDHEKGKDDKFRETMHDTWGVARDATRKVAADKAKEVVEDVGDVMRPAEEHREKVVDETEIDVERRPFDG